MEKSNTESGSSSSRSWWLDNTHNRLHQSQWLQSTLSELEKKVKKIIILIEDDGDTFAKRADMFYRKRPLLIESVEDLHRSYMSLADKYEQLMIRSENVCMFPKCGLPKRVSPKLQGTEHDQYSDSEFEGWQSIDQNQAAKLKKKCGVVDDIEKGWQLVQDNLEQQAELVKRNDEKREAINVLQTRINKLVAENIELKSKLTHMNADINRNRSRLLRAKDAILKKICPNHETSPSPYIEL